MSPLNGSKSIHYNDLKLWNQPKQDFIDMRYGLSKSSVPPNSVLFGGTVPPNSVLFGGTVPPNSFPLYFRNQNTRTQSKFYKKFL